MEESLAVSELPVAGVIGIIIIVTTIARSPKGLEGVNPCRSRGTTHTGGRCQLRVSRRRRRKVDREAPHRITAHSTFASASH
jgi:hypothetical protein